VQKFSSCNTYYVTSIRKKITPACKTAFLPDVVKYNVQLVQLKMQNSRAPMSWVEKYWQITD
jgi:hypothetical protein